MSRISSSGEFQTCRGVTVISKVSPSSQSLWENVYIALQKNPIISENYGLLPPNSYHMTTHNLYMEEEYLSWNNFIDGNLEFFQNIDQYLSQNQQAFSPILATVTGVMTQPVIQLVVSISEEQHTKLKELAAHFGIDDLQPSFLHITLAYQFKSISTEEDLKIWKYVEQEVKEIFEEDVFSLEPPSLCYFEKLTAFNRWSAERNPFIQSNFYNSPVNKSTTTSFTEGRDSRDSN